MSWLCPETREKFLINNVVSEKWKQQIELKKLSKQTVTSKTNQNSQNRTHSTFSCVAPKCEDLEEDAAWALIGFVFYLWCGLSTLALIGRGASAAREQIIWDDFIRFNWESRKRLREAVRGKTGPNRSMDDRQLKSLSLSRCSGPSEFIQKWMGTADFNIY